MTTYKIDLNNNYPNQEFDINIDEIENTLHVLIQTTVQGMLLMTVSVNDEIVGQAFNCMPNIPVIPYPYLIEQIGGNFIFETQADNYPNYEDFNNTCNLYFLTADELNNE